MKYSCTYTIALMLLMLSPVSCGMGEGNDERRDTTDSIDVDSMGLEQLELFEEVKIPESVDELFGDFLFSYITNDNFMRQRTARGVIPLQLPDEQTLVVIYEREEDLELQKDTSSVRVVMEQIEWENDHLTLFQFDRTNGRWMLSQTKDDEISNTPNAAFLVFLRDFLTDTIYQHESLHQPLTMRLYSEEDDALIETEMTTDDWDALFADLPDMSNRIINIDYGQSLFSKNRKSVQLQELSSGLFLKFHFVSTNEQWQLVEIES